MGIAIGISIVIEIGYMYGYGFSKLVPNFALNFLVKRDQNTVKPKKKYVA